MLGIKNSKREINYADREPNFNLLKTKSRIPTLLRF